MTENNTEKKNRAVKMTVEASMSHIAPAVNIRASLSFFSAL